MPIHTNSFPSWPDSVSPASRCARKYPAVIFLVVMYARCDYILDKVLAFFAEVFDLVPHFAGLTFSTHVVEISIVLFHTLDDYLVMLVLYTVCTYMQ